MDNHLKLKMLKNVLHAILKLNKVTYLVLLFMSLDIFSKTTIDDGDVIPPSPPMWEYFTINGVDSDNDGVRDDVELWINENYDDANIRRALKSLAVTYRDMLKNYDKAPDYLKANGLMIARSECLKFVMGHISSAQAQHAWGLLEDKILNNFWRSMIFKKGAENISSGIYKVADVTFHQFIVGCNFKVHNPEKIIKGFLIRNPKHKWTQKEQLQFKDMYENPDRYDAMDLFSSKLQSH